MDGWQIFLLMAIFLVVAKGPKVLAAVKDTARRYGDDPESAGALVWATAVWIMGMGFGAMATRLFWKSVSTGSMGLGGMVYLLVAIVVFAVGCGVGMLLIEVISKSRGVAGRAITAAAMLVVLCLGLFLPARHDAATADKKAAATDLAWFESNLAELQAQMQGTPHAPPGTVPPQLDVKHEGNALQVTNAGNESLWVNVLYVLPHGRQWERCWAGIVQQDCTAGQTGCPYRLDTDGTKVSAPGITTIDTNPVLRPGQTGTFTHTCDPRFRDAALEFRLVAMRDRKAIFKSDSAFVPDQPWLP